MQYVVCKQATAMPKMNNPFWNKQERCFLKRKKNDAFWNVTRMILFGTNLFLNGKEQF